MQMRHVDRDQVGVEGAARMSHDSMMQDVASSRTHEAVYNAAKAIRTADASNYAA